MPYTIQCDLLSATALSQGVQAEYQKSVTLETFSRCLANIEAAISAATPSTISKFEDIFASLSLESFDTPPQPPSAAISPAQWLLDNLHKPYPSGTTKRAMEDSPELGGRTVNEWFTRARQRIGWTRLVRDRFNGSRSSAIDAAFRAFVRDDPRSPLGAELHAAFIAVRAHANLVYTPPSPAVLETAYHPSPPFRCPSATPSLTHSTDSEDSDHEASQTFRKRKRSHSELPSDSLQVSSPPRKRRLAPPLPKTPPPLSPISTSAQNPPHPSPQYSRKRRLSQANSDELAVKKPRGLDWVPRKQTASDLLPLPAPSFDWESLYDEAFALPPPATNDIPVPGALDFELFNFEVFPPSQPASQSETRTPPPSHNNLSPPSDTAALPADILQEYPEQRGVSIDPLFLNLGQTEKGSYSTSWEEFFNFDLSCYSSTMPSLTNSPSSPSSLWSLAPPELPCFDSFEPPLFDFSSPSLFKIPTLYPVDGVEIADGSLIPL